MTFALLHLLPSPHSHHTAAAPSGSCRVSIRAQSLCTWAPGVLSLELLQLQMNCIYIVLYNTCHTANAQGNFVMQNQTTNLLISGRLALPSELQSCWPEMLPEILFTYLQFKSSLNRMSKLHAQWPQVESCFMMWSCTLWLSICDKKQNQENVTESLSGLLKRERGQ